MLNTFLAILCVTGISIGQILFKLSASGFQKAQTILYLPSLFILTAALALYGLTTLGWVWVLQTASLSRVYPIMALAFVIVPLLGHFFLRETLSLSYGLGILLIIGGIVLTLSGK
jgi:uncharacterized membrane protein